jgi:hypothetical protein
MRRKKPLIWEELVAYQPDLNDILIEMKSIKDDGPYFCKHEVYAMGWKGHRSMKRMLYRLVGYGCRLDGFMITSEAWDLAVKTLLEVLPPCRNCGCCVSEVHC